MGQDGYFTLGHWRGIPLRLHWTMPLGVLIFTRFEFAPMLWLGFVIIVLAHECGHALLVRRSEAEVLSIDMDAVGGSCSWEGEVSPLQRALIAWGGVLAQMVLLFVVEVIKVYGGWPTTPDALQLFSVLTNTNLLIAAVNLIPFPPLDGWHAWRVVPLVSLQFRSRSRAVPRQLRSHSTPPQPSPLEEVEDFTPPTREVDEFVRKTLKRLSDLASDKEPKSEDKP